MYKTEIISHFYLKTLNEQIRFVIPDDITVILQ